mmetsp:Transcript_44031/g.121842  ORF Transcript_44031/g.121842 Transcript_44031/m.121842 type:complete len:296 (-) Transcript_44031:331-1218(-)
MRRYRCRSESCGGFSTPRLVSGAAGERPRACAPSAAGPTWQFVGSAAVTPDGLRPRREPPSIAWKAGGAARSDSGGDAGGDGGRQCGLGVESTPAMVSGLEAPSPSRTPGLPSKPRTSAPATFPGVCLTCRDSCCAGDPRRGGDAGGTPSRIGGDRDGDGVEGRRGAGAQSASTCALGAALAGSELRGDGDGVTGACAVGDSLRRCAGPSTVLSFVVAPRMVGLPGSEGRSVSPTTWDAHPAAAFPGSCLRMSVGPFASAAPLATAAGTAAPVLREEQISRWYSRSKCNDRETRS